MTEGFLARAIVGHLFGDFILQNHWMAQRKKSSTPACALHCLVYTAAVHAFTLLAMPWWALVVVFLTHFVQDRTTLVQFLMDRVLGQEGFRKGLAPWASIVVDNTLHLTVLWLISVIA